MRTSINNNGFSSLAELVTRDPKFARNVCQNVRKEQGGQGADKNVSMTVEDRLELLVVFAKYLYLASRTLAYQEITLDRLRSIMEYWTQLQETKKPEMPPKFKDSCNKRKWFESIEAYLALATGTVSGFPILYVIIDNNLAAYPDIGDPTFDEELKYRGRHNGSFWSGDNRAVFLLLKALTFETHAWTVVERFQRINDGQGAY